MQGKKQYREKLFRSFRLSERVPQDNFYRRLDELPDLKWLYQATTPYYGTEGHRSIDPVVFIKLMLIGYLENIISDRRLIATASMRMDMLLFLGYNIDEPLPWHSTLSRTRQLLGEAVFKQLFQRVLQQCIDKGMVAGKRQAVDSVFVKAHASLSSLVKKEIPGEPDSDATQINPAQQQQQVSPPTLQADEGINSTTAAADNHQPQQPVCPDSEADHQPEGNHLIQLPAVNRQRSSFSSFGSNQTHISTTDPDAKVSVKPGKPAQLNYLAQLSVDTASHVITNIEAHTADHRDSECLSSVVGNTVALLQAEGLQVEEVLADTGYSSGSALKYLEEHHITGYIPSFGPYKPEREDFTYDQDNDRYTCSRGVHLPLHLLRTTKEGYHNKLYRSAVKDCRDCPLRTQCLGQGSSKQLEDSVDKPYYDRMHERMQTARARRMIRRRAATVEPVIGTLVNYLGMKRVNTHGLELANKCMVMAAVAYNLKKLLKHQSNSRATMANALKAAVKNCLSAFLGCLVQPLIPKMTAHGCKPACQYALLLRVAYQEKCSEVLFKT
jgi:transposase